MCRFLSSPYPLSPPHEGELMFGTASQVLRCRSRLYRRRRGHGLSRPVCGLCELLLVRCFLALLTFVQMKKPGGN